MADDKTQEEVHYKDLRSFGRLLLKFVILFLTGMFIVELVGQSTVLNLKQTTFEICKSSFQRFFHRPKQTYSGFRVKKQLSSSRQNNLDNDSLAQYLHREVRVLCWALVKPKQHNFTIHMKQTWGKRCNQFELISTATDETNMTLHNYIEAKSNNTWLRTVAIYKFLYARYQNTSDWFYRADDFTYTIMENLRLMLYPYSPQTAIYFGYRFDGWPKRGYTGGFGLILSKEALRRLVELNATNSKICAPEVKTEKLSDIDEYVKLEKCLKNLNVSVGKTRDKNGPRKFLPSRWQMKLMPQDKNLEEWAIEYSFYKLYEGFNCCSKHFVTFHYVRPSAMYTFEYLLYYLRPYGVANKYDLLPAKLMMNEM